MIKRNLYTLIPFALALVSCGSSETGIVSKVRQALEGHLDETKLSYEKKESEIYSLQYGVTSGMDEGTILFDKIETVGSQKQHDRHISASILHENSNENENILKVIDVVRVMSNMTQVTSFDQMKDEKYLNKQDDGQSFYSYHPYSENPWWGFDLTMKADGCSLELCYEILEDYIY